MLRRTIALGRGARAFAQRPRLQTAALYVARRVFGSAWAPVSRERTARLLNIVQGGRSDAFVPLASAGIRGVWRVTVAGNARL